MRRLVSLVSATVLAATATIAASAAPVSAAPQIWTYAGHSGGTQVNALGTTISSGMTAASNLSDTVVPNQIGVQVASVRVAGLVNVGAITSGQQAVAFGDGVKITSRVKIAGVNLLNGAIIADAVESTSYASAKNATALGAEVDAGTSTTFVRLTIGGKAYPVDVPANTKVTIPGLAEIVLNESQVGKSFTGKTARSVGTAIHVTLLQSQGGAPAGAEIKLNPTSASVFPTGPSDALPIGGFAYGTYAAVGAGNDVEVLVQPTGIVTLPSSGTNGKVYENEIAAVNAPQVASASAIRTTVNGTTIPGYADADTGARLAKLNLLNGLVTADAIEVTTHVRKSGAENISEARLNFVNLVVAGRKIPINVARNTQIYVLGVGQIYINQQKTRAGYAAIVGVRITLSTKQYGLPVGTDIQAAVSSSYIYGVS